MDIRNPILGVSLVLGLACSIPAYKAPNSVSKAEFDPASLPKEWLKQESSLQVIEKSATWGPLFGYSREEPENRLKKWASFKQLSQPGDTIWRWESVSDKQGRFTFGYCFVRNQTVVGLIACGVVSTY